MTDAIQSVEVLGGTSDTAKAIAEPITPAFAPSVAMVEALRRYGPAAIAVINTVTNELLIFDAEDSGGDAALATLDGLTLTGALVPDQPNKATSEVTVVNGSARIEELFAARRPKFSVMAQVSRVLELGITGVVVVRQDQSQIFIREGAAGAVAAVSPHSHVTPVARFRFNP